MKVGLIRTWIFVGLVLATKSPACAQTFFETSFEEPALHSGLEDADAAFEAPSGVIRRNSPLHDEDRHFLRTADSDYFATGPFSFEVSFTNPEGSLGTLQYIGLGAGTPNPGYYNEPGPITGTAGTGTGSVYLRIHSPDLVDGRIDWAFNYGLPDEQVLAEAIGYIHSVGLNRARITATSDELTVAIDEDYTGIFAATISATIDLNAYPQIKSVLMSESRAFFGTARSAIEYDDFVIAPEPVSELILMLGLAMLGSWRCRKQS